MTMPLAALLMAPLVWMLMSLAGPVWPYTVPALAKLLPWMAILLSDRISAPLWLATAPPALSVMFCGATIDWKSTRLNSSHW